MLKHTFFLVSQGAAPGIYPTWIECQKQIAGFEGAVYKSFPTFEQAKKAFSENPYKHIGNNKPAVQLLVGDFKNHKIIKNSISVDGAWNTVTGDAEYRGVNTATKEELFRKGPYADGTNNIMEFLAIVHALAYCKKHALTVPIYSDSVTALSWIKKKKAKTKLENSGRNHELFDLINRAEKWLNENPWSNKLLKWDTQHWGENPADFGRK